MLLLNAISDPILFENVILFPEWCTLKFELCRYSTPSLVAMLLSNLLASIVILFLQEYSTPPQVAVLLSNSLVSIVILLLSEYSTPPHDIGCKLGKGHPPAQWHNPFPGQHLHTITNPSQALITLPAAAPRSQPH